VFHKILYCQAGYSFVNRKFLSTLLVVTIISMAIQPAFADTVSFPSTICQEGEPLDPGVQCDEGADLGAADVIALLALLGIPAGSEVLAETFEVPTDPTAASIDLTFTVQRDTGIFLYSFGFCPASSVIGIDPLSQKQAWATACLAAATEVFDDTTSDVGDTFLVNLVPGTVEIFYLIPNNDLATFNADPTQFYPSQTSVNAFRAPLFSVEDANPGEFDQMLSFIGGGFTLFTFEDLTRSDIVPPGASDQDFTDLAFSIDIEIIPKPFCEIFPTIPACTLVGGEVSPIDTKVLLVAGATSPIAFYMYAFSALGIGALWFSLNPFNRRNVKAILSDYFDRFSKTN
jgi:hypothetical protein